VRSVSKVSVLIPARNELFLPETVDDVLDNATGDVECIVYLDGYWPDPPLQDRDNLVIIHRTSRLGMRDGVNAMAAVASGDYLMKCDAHCSFAEGYDEELAADCEDNWIVVPRRYSLDAERWCRRDKGPVDAMRYFYPYEHPDDLGLHGKPWSERGRALAHGALHEDITFQGSCWFMSRAHWERLGPMQVEGYGSFMGEPQELGLKTQLGPWHGLIVRNKRTWYAHLHKGKQYGRMYSMDKAELKRGNAYSFDFWWHNRWAGRAHDIEWLIDRFPPMPGWPEDWKERKHEEG
jgi:glycosyltransferase involved in cell wall biosynthesis